MEAVRVHSGRAVPLVRSDVDTDQIIPSDWLKRVERTGFGQGLFERYSGATVLVAGPSFGTGSSREHAVWALMDYGFAAVVAPSFGDIFRNNSTKNGLVPVQIPAEAVQRLQAALADRPDLEVVVDVERRVVEVPAIGLSEPFPLDDATQERFLEGLDDIGITLRSADAIAAHEANRPEWMPSTRQ
jgi:3-isopropylmalate/(R)-2-methylmalate dehydratase small subunit